MHRCLDVHDIIYNILCFYHADPTRDRGTLKALAFTCKAWSEPALDPLWHTVPSVHRLLHLLPSNCWGEQDVVQFVLMTLARPLVRADWDRVVVYSTQVRRITEPFSILDNATGRAINPSDIAAVASAAFVANLFPCLSYAFFALDATEQSAHFPSIAMVPSLRRTVWHISNSPSTPIPMEPVLQLFTRFIRNCSLQITSLELHGCIYSAVEQLLYPSLTQFAHLIHLTDRKSVV